jgi:hypothetical protein
MLDPDNQYRRRPMSLLRRAPPTGVTAGERFSHADKPVLQSGDRRRIANI